METVLVCKGKQNISMVLVLYGSVCCFMSGSINEDVNLLDLQCIQSIC